MAPVKTPNAPRGTIRGSSSQNIVTFTIRASPLPRPILDFILENLETLKKLQHDKKWGETTEDQEDLATVDIYGDVIRKPNVRPENFWVALQERSKEVGGEWEGLADKIWAFGPQKAGGCLLIDARKPASINS